MAAVLFVGIAVLLVWRTGDSGARPAKAVLGAQVSGYSVFSRAETAKDTVSADWATPPGNPRITPRIEQARLVYQDDSRTIYAVPTADSVCLLTHFPLKPRGWSCGNGPDEEAGSTTLAGGFGLVPDSVKTVTFTMTDGTTRVENVVDNFWHSPVEAATVAYTVGDRSKKYDLMPPSLMPKGTERLPSGWYKVGAGS